MDEVSQKQDADQFDDGPVTCRKVYHEGSLPEAGSAADHRLSWRSSSLGSGVSAVCS